MARKPNYGFEKRQKELDRKTKKEDKQRRREEGEGAGRDEGTVAESDTEPGFDEYGRPLAVIPGAGNAPEGPATA